MKKSEPISSVPPEKPVPSLACGDACEFIYWMAIQESDITVQQAKRYILMLLEPQHPQPPTPVYISAGTRSIAVVYGPQYEGFKEGSEEVLDANNLPDDVKKRLQQRFLRPPGYLMNDDRCGWPCECVKDRNSPPEAAGLGEQVITTWIDTNKVIDEGTIRRFDGSSIPPDPEKLINDDGKPVTFDPETDYLEFYGIAGPQGIWQIWRVIRRYRSVVVINIKYQVTRQTGTCKELIEA